MERRKFISALGLSGLGMSLSSVDVLAASLPSLPPFDGQDEAYWKEVGRQFRPKSEDINFNSGAMSPQPNIVQDGLRKLMEETNQLPSLYFPRWAKRYSEDIRVGLASIIGAEKNEIAIIRNTTEGINIVLQGLDLTAKDQVLMSDMDYPSVRDSVKQIAERKGVHVVEIKLPVSHHVTDDEICRLYEDAITANTKLIVLTYILHYTGQQLPVKRIIEIAHKKGTKVLLDAAHAYAHISHSVKDLDCDFYATSLHKWFYGPIGMGLLYIKQELVKDVWPLFPPTCDMPKEKMEKYEHYGTFPFPAMFALQYAIQFNKAIGIENKYERLLYFKKTIADGVEQNKNIEMTIPIEASCGMFHLTIKNHELIHVYRELRKVDFHTARRSQGEKFSGLRISPNIFNSIEEVQGLVDALNRITG